MLETINSQLHKDPVCRISLGTWAIGGWCWGGSDDQESIKTIHKALDLGINLIDTAPVYGFGKSEEVVGHAIKQSTIERSKIILATKVGLDWHHGHLFQNSEPKRIIQEVEDSLRRLQTDYIDIYQIHWPDPIVPLEEVANAMHNLVKSGKIRAIGVSNFTLTQIEEFTKFAPIHATQPPLNLFERDIEKNGVLNHIESAKLLTLAYRPLCGGLLSGTINANSKFSQGDIRNFDPKFKEPNFSKYLAAITELDQFARTNYNKNILSLSIRWLLDKSSHIIALYGARKPWQLDALKEIEGWQLSINDFIEIDKIINKHIIDPVGIKWLEVPARIEYID